MGLKLISKRTLFYEQGGVYPESKANSIVSKEDFKTFFAESTEQRVEGRFIENCVVCKKSFKVELIIYSK